MSDHTTQAGPDPALKRMEAMVGTWEMKGHTLDTTEINITGRMTCEWLPGGFFLKQTGEITFKGFKIQSLEVIGYDPASQTFPSHAYTNVSGGRVETYHWDVQGRIVTHWAETSKYTGTLSDDGRTLTGGWRPLEGKEPEGDGGDAYDVVMIRVD